MSVPVRDQVFISYSHKDRRWLDELQVMLKPLTRNRTVTVWREPWQTRAFRWARQHPFAVAIGITLSLAAVLAADVLRSLN